jgi:hypothetical protein
VQPPNPNRNYTSSLFALTSENPTIICVVDWLRQAVQDPSEINGDNLNNIRCETRRHFRNKKREYLKDKIDELATNSKNKNIRDLYKGINDFKRVYQPRSNFFFVGWDLRPR